MSSILRTGRPGRIGRACRIVLTAAVAFGLAVAIPVTPGAAQSRISPGVTEPEGAAAASGEELGLHVYTLRHQQAEDAARLIRPLLSPRGTVAVQAEANTIQVRDSLNRLSRILPELRSFDRPGLEIEIRIVRASTDDGLSRFRPTVGAGSPLPPKLEQELRQLSASTHGFTHFDLVAEAKLATREGEDIAFEIGERYSVRFRLGELVEVARGEVVQLDDFRVLRNTGPALRGAPNSPSNSASPSLEETLPGQSRVLLRTRFSLLLGRTIALGLARAESSPSALMVILHCRQITGGEE